MSMQDRIDRINERIEGTAAEENVAEFGDQPERYLVIEKANGETLWAFTCETLEECATSISDSDTDREYVFIVDLDVEDSSDAELTVILSVTRIMGRGVDFVAEVKR